MTYDPREMELTLEVLTNLMRSVIGDGGSKRAAGTKPPWWEDDGHNAALDRHEDRYWDGELVDKDSGAHPRCHVGVRALMQAGKELYEAGRPDLLGPAFEELLELERLRTSTQ